MSSRRLLTIGFLVLLMCAGFPSFSYAYLDPGTGSYIFQLLIAGLLGLAFLLKVYWNKVKSFVLGLFSGDEKVEVEEGETKRV